MSTLVFTERSRNVVGEVEIIVRDRAGRTVRHDSGCNLIKIFAKEILAHRLPFTQVWDPTASSGAGAWVASGLDVGEEFAPKYILFGASFDQGGAPLDRADERFYTLDPVSGSYIPNTLQVGATFEGGLVNAIPLADPSRPLKKVERIYFEPTYQPAGTPLLQADVRAMNNIVVLETTLRLDEYNGLGTSASDYFTVAEVALAAGKSLDAAGSCECSPERLFLEGRSDGTALSATAPGTATVTIDSGESNDPIVEGDQVKIVAAGVTAQEESTLDQVNQYYLVTSKVAGGSDVVLDRVPVDSNGTAITGQIGLFRSTLRIYSHRILAVPFRKSADFEVIVRWRLILN